MKTLVTRFPSHCSVAVTPGAIRALETSLKTDHPPRPGQWFARLRTRRTACRTADIKKLHECRKQAKYLWHQLQLLEAVRPRRMKRLERRAHMLSGRLGDDHDLAVLRDKIEAVRLALPRGAVTRIESMIESRRGELQRDALALAQRLYGLPPSHFVARVGADWHAWRSGRKPRR